MIVATILGVLMTPALYRMIQGLSEKLGGKKKDETTTPSS